jgi:Concanavalin A-like lectin/glucanases superfamily
MPLSVGKKKQTAGFDPRSIPGCITWLDASDPKTLLSASPASSGTPVGANGSVNFWFDKSAASNHLTVGTAGSPTRTISYSNNLDAVRFQGNYMNGNSSSGNYPIDLFVIVSLSNTSHAWDVCTVGSISNGSFNSLTFGEFAVSNWHNGSDYFNRTSNAISSNIESSTSLLLMEWSIADSNYVIRRNGTTIMKNNVYTYAPIQQSIFAVGIRNPNVGTTGNNLYGYIGEIVAFNTQLTSLDRTKIEGYLANKWRLQTGLPTTHPYYYNFPFTRPFNPLDVGGCLLWLDGADQNCNSMTTSSGNVTAWFDKSGNGGNTTSSSTSRPTTTTINGVPAIQLTTGNGSSPKWFIGSWGGKVYNPTGITAFVVATENAGGATVYYPRLFHIGSNDNSTFHMSIICGNQGTGKPGIISYNNGLSIGTFFPGNIANQIQLPAYDTPFILMNRVTTLGSGYYLSELGLNGTSLCAMSNTVGGTTSNFNTYSVGGYLDNTVGLGDNWFGKIGEIILYSNVLTIQQQQQVEGYLSKKWGISMSPCNTVPCNFNCNAIWLDFADTTSLTLSGTNITAISNKGVKGGSFTNIAASAAVCNAYSQNGLVTAQILQSNSFSNNITLPNQSRVIFVAMKASYSNTPTSGNWVTSINFGNGAPTGSGADNAALSYASNWFGYTGYQLVEVAQGYVVNTNADLPPAINLNGAFNILTFVVSSNTALNRCAVNGVSYYLNGANYGTGSYSTGNREYLIPRPDSLSWLSYNGSYAYTSNVSVWTINLGEYLLYNGEMTTNQISQIENYLMAKWAVTPCNVGTGIQSMYRIPALSAQPFTPISVTGLTLWLDANDPYGSNYIPPNSTTLVTWYDKSGSNKNFAATGTISFNQNPSRITFNGSSSMSNTSFTNQYFGMFIAFNNNSVGPLFTSQINDYTNNNYQVLFPNSSNSGFKIITGKSGASDTFTTTGVTSNVITVVYVGFDSTSTYYSIDGVFSSNTNTYPILTGESLQLGLGQSVYYTGSINEIIRFESHLSDDTRKIIEGYLAWKWRQKKLPLSHPYFRLSPSLVSVDTLADGQIVTSSLIQNLDGASYVSGSTWTALTGNNYTISGTLTTTSTPGGSTAVVFDGSAYAQDLTGFSWYYTDYTIDAWFYASDGEDGSIIGEIGQAYLGGYHVFLMGVYYGSFYSGFYTDNAGVYNYSFFGYTSNTWTHVAYSYSSGTLVHYKNGFNMGTSYNYNKIWPDYGTVYFTVGGSANPYGTFAGQIGAVKVYNRVLSDAEVLQNFNALKGRYGAVVGQGTGGGGTGTGSGSGTGTGTGAPA